MNFRAEVLPSSRPVHTDAFGRSRLQPISAQGTRVSVLHCTPSPAPTAATNLHRVTYGEHKKRPYILHCKPSWSGIAPHKAAVTSLPALQPRAPSQSRRGVRLAAAPVPLSAAPRGTSLRLSARQRAWWRCVHDAQPRLGPWRQGRHAPSSGGGTSQAPCRVQPAQWVRQRLGGAHRKLHPRGVHAPRGRQRLEGAQRSTQPPHHQPAVALPRPCGGAGSPLHSAHQALLNGKPVWAISCSGEWAAVRRGRQVTGAQPCRPHLTRPL
jgi:hypothetical protein